MATETVAPARPELEPLPRHMQHLPVDPQRGYVVPWFVDWIDGKPEFRAMNRQKYFRAIRERLCWVCGEKIGSHYAFVVGPMCGINRISSEPPSHIDCARWSARNCPFLSNPSMVRREDGLLDNNKLREASPGICIARNPGVALVWITREYEVISDGRGGVLIQMGKPTGVEWYCRGRAATREEVEESIDNGIGALEAVARTEAGGIEALRRAQSRFEKFLPKE